MSGQTSRTNSSVHDNTDLNRRSLRNELLNLIRSSGCVLPPNLDDETSLVTSGLLDSLALFNLTLWIESKIGRPIDPTCMNIAHEWDSIENILQYLGYNTHPKQVQGSATYATASLLTLSDYRILNYSPTHKRAVAEFQTALWSPDQELNLRYLDWKYEHNPYASDGRIYLAFYKDSLVGMRGFYGSWWEVGVPARRVSVLVADDLLVHEDHRNRGLVAKIMQAAFKDLRGLEAQFLFNLSGSTLTVLNSIAMGWRSIGMLKPMGRRSFGGGLLGAVRLQLRSLPYLWRYAAVATERHAFARLDRAPARLLEATGLKVEISTQARPNAMATLIGRIGYDGRLRHLRDHVYFDWRFRNPLCEYRFLYVGGKELQGYLVLQRPTNALHPSARVNIVDLEAVSGYVQAALLKVAVTAGAFSELVIWTSTASGLLLETLGALGFKPFDHEQAALGRPCFLVRPIDADQNGGEWRLDDVQLLDHRSWDIRMLYSMSG